MTWLLVAIHTEIHDASEMLEGQILIKVSDQLAAAFAIQVPEVEGAQEVG